MKSTKLILKGILLWISTLIVLLSVCGIDSIADKGYGWLFGIVVLNIMLILACFDTITEEEYKIVSGYNLFNKALKLDED
jgi:hypothetical protein|nr:MAG TPA: hypothetical protein [Crassvirales sp.]